MRVLCIHGNGDHHEDFRMEVIPLEEELRRFVGYNVEFDYFITEEIPRDIPWVILRDYVRDSPHWTPFHASDTSSVQKSIATLYEFILAHGPYEGVLAFSMGAALASTAMMLHDQILGDESFGDQPLFQFAINVCGVPPQLATSLPAFTEDTLPRDEWIQIAGAAAAQVLKEVEKQTGNESNEWSSACNFSEPEAEVLDAGDESATKLNFHGISLDLNSLQRVPTVHAMGGRDDYLLSASLALFQMSRGMGCARYVEHHEGHSMPKSTTSLRKLAYVCSEVMNQVLEDGRRQQPLDLNIQHQKKLALYNWCKRVRDPSEIESDQDLPSTWNIIEEKLEIHHPAWKAIVGHEYGRDMKDKPHPWTM